MSKHQVLEQVYIDEIDYILEQDIISQLEHINSIAAALGTSESEESYANKLQKQLEHLQGNNNVNNDYEQRVKTDEELDQEFNKLRNMFDSLRG